MRNLHIDTGCVFDTLAFLSAFFEDAAIEKPPCYQRITDKLLDNGAVIPHYLYPFFARLNGKPSFMDILLFDGVPYSKCIKEPIFHSIKNTSFVIRKYIEHYFHGLSVRTVHQCISKHPDGIDMMKKQSLDPALEMYVYYSLVRSDEVLAALYPVFELVYSEMENEHNLFISGQALDLSVENKLRAISGVGKEERLQYSFTLIEPGRISFLPGEPAFFLLGCDYENTLETEYKYIGVTPYSFALSIGNPTKYAIYLALLKKSPMTRAEMEKTLHLSRAALDHHLKDMREAGLVVMSRRQGDTFYYDLDTEVIRMAAVKTLTDAHLYI